MKKIFLDNLIIILLIIISGCQNQVENSQDQDKLQVAVTIAPIQEIVEQIGSEKVQVSVMIPTGATPHTYEPTPSQFQEIAQTDAYVKVGTDIEFEIAWLDKIIATNRAMSIINASESIDFIQSKDHDHGSENPHTWLSLKNAQIMVENIYQSLIEVDPGNQTYYNSNKETYLQELEELDSKIDRDLSSIDSRQFMVFHPAWSYYARDYDLEEIPIEEQGKEPTAQDIQRVIDQAKEYHIRVIIASPEFDAKSAETIASEILGQVVLISPMEKDIKNNIKQITNTLVQYSAP